MDRGAQGAKTRIMSGSNFATTAGSAERGACVISPNSFQPLMRSSKPELIILLSDAINSRRAVVTAGINPRSLCD